MQCSAPLPLKGEETFSATHKFITTAQKSRTAELGIILSGRLHWAVTLVRKRPTRQGAAVEEVHSMVFLLGSVEPRLLFGWLQMFAAFMELGFLHKIFLKKSDWRERFPIIYAVLSEHYNCMHILCSLTDSVRMFTRKHCHGNPCTRKVWKMSAKLYNQFDLIQARSQRWLSI